MSAEVTQEGEAPKPVKAGSETQPWEQLEDETAAQFKMFRLYRDLGPDRTKIEAYRVGRGKPDADVPSGTFMKWARENRWDDRVLAYDRWVDRERQKRMLNDRLERDVLHVRSLRGLQSKLLIALAHKDPHDITMRDIISGMQLVIEKERLIGGDDTDRVSTSVEKKLFALFMADPELARQVESASTDEEAYQLLQKTLGDENEIVVGGDD